MIASNVGHFETLKLVSIMILLICSIDFVNSPQYQQMITSNIGDYETIQLVSITNLLI